MATSTHAEPLYSCSVAKYVEVLYCVIPAHHVTAPRQLLVVFGAVNTALVNRVVVSDTVEVPHGEAALTVCQVVAALKFPPRVATLTAIHTLQIGVDLSDAHLRALYLTSNLWSRIVHLRPYEECNV